MAAPFETPEELVEAIRQLLDSGRVLRACELVRSVDEWFPDSALAHHAAGLVWERAYLEAMASGETPDLGDYERAEHHYRRAMGLESDGDDELHADRLFACLFVLGTQRNDRARLEEALELAKRLSGSESADRRETFMRERAIVATAIAKQSQELADWQRAFELFEGTESPVADRELFFYYYYRGLVARELGSRGPDQAMLRSAAQYLHAARTGQDSVPLSYMEADCLVQLEAPDDNEFQRAARLVNDLCDLAPEDPTIQKLKKRWDLRRKLVE